MSDPSPSRTDPPFFIVGCPRSGTTLLQLLLDAHPHIAIPPETHIFKRFHFGCYEPLDDPRNLLRFSTDLLSDDHVRMMGLTIGADRFVDGIDRPSRRSVLSRLFGLFAEKEGALRWGEKTPQHCLYLPDIVEVFPEARFVHIVRDGRDVAASCAHTIVGPQSALGVARMWTEYLESFHRFSRDLDRRRYIEVKYEELVANPESEVERVFGFLGEEPPNIERTVPQTERQRQYLATDVHMSPLQGKIRTRNVARFRSELSDREIQLCERTGGDWLRRYGYEDVGVGPVSPPRWSEVGMSRFEDVVVRCWKKYVRPFELPNVWALLRRELQYFLRTARRCIVRRVLT